MGSMRLLVVCAVVVCALASPQCPPPSTSGRSGGGGGGMSNGGGQSWGQGNGGGQGGQGGDGGQGMNGGDDDEDKGKSQCDCKNCMKDSIAAIKCVPDYSAPDPCKLVNVTSEQEITFGSCGDGSQCALGPATLGDVLEVYGDHIQAYYCTPDCPKLKKKAQALAPYVVRAMMLDPVNRYPQAIRNIWSAASKAYIRGQQDYMAWVFQIHLDYCLLSNSDIGI